MSRSNVLVMYKNLLKLANSLQPADKRVESIRLIQEEFRRNVDADPIHYEQLMKKADSTLGYLKIVTPKTAQRQSQQGITKIVFGKNDDNTTTKRPAKAMSNWTGSNVDPDALKRHHSSLKRAGFKSHRDAKGIF